MWHNERTTDQMIAAIREIGPEEARETWKNLQYEKYGVVAALKTSPKGFEEYIRKRQAADRKAKTGR